MTLSKYQRSLVPYFKKYQLTELEGDKKTRRIFSTDNLGEKTRELLEGEELEDREIENSKKLQLIETVRELFDSGSN